MTTLKIFKYDFSYNPYMWSSDYESRSGVQVANTIEEAIGLIIESYAKSFLLTRKHFVNEEGHYYGIGLVDTERPATVELGSYSFLE